MYKAFLNTLKRELNRIKEYPLILVIMIAIPLAVCFVLCETFKEGSPKDLPVAVLDLDNSDLSRKITRMIDATASCKTVQNVLDVEDGHQQIVSGKAYGFILIPKRFKADILQGKRPQLVYYYNNNLLLIGGIITKDINTAIQTSLGELTTYVYSTKGMSKNVAASQVNIVKVDEHIKGNPYLNYSYLLSTAAFINTFQIIATFLAIFAIGTEFLPVACRDEWFPADGTVFHHRGNCAILTVYLSPYRFLKIWLKRKYSEQEVVAVDGSVMDGIIFGADQKAWLIIFDAGPSHEVGTFRPGKEEHIPDHEMHSEYIEVTRESADIINARRAAGGRVVAGGTTSCRTLESATDENGILHPMSADTGIFIYPGFRFKCIDALITNFHLPESTLIMLVSALAGRDHVLAAYEEAIRERYRFFSFGDAMFIR